MSSMLTKKELVQGVLDGTKYIYDINSTTTLTISDMDGEMVGYGSGESLTMILREMINEHLGPVNKERIARLTPLLKSNDNPSPKVVIAACIDPLIEALGSHDARLVHFCHRAILLEDVDIDSHLWWTPVLSDLIKKIFGARNNEWSGGQKAATLNYMIYYVIGRGLKTSNTQIPLGDTNRESVRKWLYGLSATILFPDFPDHQDPQA